MRQSESAGVRLAGAGATEGAARRAIPLRRRRRDLPFVGFFLLNLCFITYVVDVEQLIIADPANGQGGPANLANFCIGGSSVIDSFVKLDSTQRLSGVSGGVNQFAALIFDANGGTYPVVTEIACTPLYLIPQ